ncbi:MAG: DnaJ domain-containing protein [Nitrospirota bacterium]|nr:DnaJ domain-containing protein [Nitrospirota bacterium]
MFMKYILPVLLVIYIISPFDAYPLFLDDLVAAGALFYVLYKYSGKKKQQSYCGHRSQQGTETPGNGRMDLNKAYSLLGIGPDASEDEISRAYKEKMSRSHPDKVAHMREELQQKAKELTLELNEAYNLIKQYRK